jgi:hypothetical protein
VRFSPISLRAVIALLIFLAVAAWAASIAAPADRPVIVLIAALGMLFAVVLPLVLR